MKETRWNRNGVIAIDDTLLPKTGRKIPGAEKFLNHNSNAYLYGQSLVTSHYANLDYPINFRQYFKQEILETVKYSFQNKCRFSPGVCILL